MTCWSQFQPFWINRLLQGMHLRQYCYWSWSQLIFFLYGLLILREFCEAILSQVKIEVACMSIRDHNTVVTFCVVKNNIISNALYSASYSGNTNHVATLLWPSVGVKPSTWKSWDLESSGTPECSELDSKGQNTSHWGVLSVVEKVLKRRYRKFPGIGNSNISSPSYGQKKGRESNWQFDSRPLKARNRPLPDVRFECTTWRWKDLDEDYNFGLDLVAIQLCSRELWRFKVPRVPLGQFRDSISGVPGICAIWM